MDPMKLAESATDLNLKLMRWRLIPELNLEKIRFVSLIIYPHRKKNNKRTPF